MLLTMHPGGTIVYIDTSSHVGDAVINDYYVVLAEKAGRTSGVASSTGSFDFGLAPGGPP